MRVIFDTNIYISAFAIPGGKAEQAYLHAIRGTFQLFTSIAILTETANTLATKFGWSEEKLQEFLFSVTQTATVLRTRPHVHILKDKPDNRILECALAADADLIVTGDRHLLTLKKFQSVTIISLANFLKRLE